jgi:STE24 endopeptidase
MAVVAVVDAVGLFGAEQVARARRYHRPLYAAAVARTGLNLVVLTLIVFGPLGRPLLDPFAGWPWWASVLAITLLVEAIVTAVDLPLSLWAGFRRERAWGFSTQTLSGFATDRAKSFALGFGLTAAALLGLVGSARAWPRLWPLAAACGGAVLVLLLGVVGPVLIEPLFNRFEPLADDELAAELRALAEQAGLGIKEVLVADASRRTRKANAYVSGAGPARRLVLYDTLLERAGRPEIGLVLAHELGHRRYHHVLKAVALATIGIAGFVVLLWALLRSPDVRSAVGAPGGAADPRVVPVVLLVGAAVQVPLAPFGAALSRSWERLADAFSLDLTGSLATFESAHRSLAIANLSDLDPPRPVYLAFFTHPTPVERIQAARGRARGTRAASR